VQVAAIGREGRRACLYTRRIARYRPNFEGRSLAFRAIGFVRVIPELTNEATPSGREWQVATLFCDN
jgi:hypothetical protein